MIPRMIASDLDGTLFTPDSTISARTEAALTAAREAGITVVFATGRSHFSALPIIDGRDLADWLVCSNGATVWHPGLAEVHRRLTVTDTALRPLFDGARSAFPDCSFAWETPGGFNWEPNWPTFGEAIFEAEAGDDSVIDDGSIPINVTKVLLTVPGVEPLDLIDPVTEMVPTGVAVSTSGVPFVEITNADAHKAATLGWLCAEHGIDPTEVMVFGDNHNDASMLKWAGHSVVMETAPDAVKELADEIARPNTEDGVAVVIEAVLEG